jgi:signal transduction histidine kinase
LLIVILGGSGTLFGPLVGTVIVVIIKNIIEAHNGRIWFESIEGKGTVFYFTIPIEEKFAEFLKEF